MVGERRADRDRHLRKARGDPEQDQAAERVAEPESSVQRIRRARQRDTGDPDHNSCDEEDRDQRR